MRISDLKRETEALIWVVPEQEMATYNVKCRMNNTAVSDGGKNV